MSGKRLLSTMLILALALMAGTAQAGHKSYSLTAGSGAQQHIGNGLPLPIQPVALAPAGTGTSFPVLGIGLASGGPKTVMQTTAMGSQNKLTVPASVLSKAPAQKTLGLFVSNPLLYAVATNLGFKWPGAVAAVFSTAARTGPKTVKFITLLGNNIRYSNPLAKKFGGPARFLASAGAPAGLMPAVPATIFAVAVLGPLGNPPCTHTALTPVPFPGTFAKSLCLAALGQALPSLVTTGPMLGAHGGPVGLTLSTPGGTPAAVVGVPPPAPFPALASESSARSRLGPSVSSRSRARPRGASPTTRRATATRGQRACSPSRRPWRSRRKSS